MNEQREWDRAAHQHCHCGMRLVEQPYEHSPLLCIRCGYLGPGPDVSLYDLCSCDSAPCESCGREP